MVVLLVVFPSLGTSPPTRWPPVKTGGEAGQTGFPVLGAGRTSGEKRER